MVEHLASLPESQVSKVFATTRRQSSPQLAGLVDKFGGRVSFVQLDITDPKSIQDATLQVQQELQGKGLDVLVNNAAVMPITPGGVEKMENLGEAFDINVTGAHLVTQAFLPLLRQGQRKVITNISTTLGSITRAPLYKASSFPAYKITKAAMNMLTVQYALALADEGFVVLAINPDWLRTDTDTAQPELPVETRVEAVVKVVLNVTAEDNGRFHNILVPGWEHAEGLIQYDGKDIPW